MYRKPLLNSLRTGLLFLVVLLFSPGICRVSAQCNNWSISAQLITASTCASNGSFQVNVSGPDAANLTNLQYAIPISANNFSVPLNSSSLFSSIPPGSYQVSALATCGGTTVGKNTTITIPGNYVPPLLTGGVARGTLSCGSFGRVNVSIYFGRPPFTVTITNAPLGYNGPTVFTTSAGGYSVGGLPAGTYTLQVLDACGSGTNPVVATVGTLNANTLALLSFDVAASGCNAITVRKPTIDYNSTPWAAYAGDTVFKISAQISNGLTAATPFLPMDNASFSLPLLPGYSIKDCYGKTIIYTIKPACGPTFTYTQSIPYPQLQYSNSQNCNVGFTSSLSFLGAVCYPVSITMVNTATSTIYGPYSMSAAGLNTPSLPIGSYTASYTTADGYTNSIGISTAPVQSNPYSVTVMNGAPGLQNYIQGFQFSTVFASANATIELFSGPAGYSFTSGWYGSNIYHVIQNQTPVLPGTLYFPAGNYVWKITDDCGTYYLPINVGPQHLYQFTVGIATQKHTCQGLWIWPTGTATNNGTSVPVKFSLLKNGSPVYVPQTSIWAQYAIGDSILINTPGLYTLVPSADIETFFADVPYPNVYAQSYSFTYSVLPVQVDMNSTQGFLCKGAGPGQAQIYTKGKNGMPWTSPSVHYTYYLALQGNGANGPYLASNTTGAFTNFGGNANNIYDVKIVDSCGAFAIQAIRILDLGTTRLISSSNYVACEHNDVQLLAAYLPNATYSWTGPNGFTSSLQQPLITNIGPQNIGVYKVTITTSACNQAVTDSTTITMAGNPPKPIVSVDCGPPRAVTITNPASGIKYTWSIALFGFTINSQPSNVGYTRYVTWPGSYRAVALDTTTGCRTYSDSTLFGDPDFPMEATIYSPHLQLCTGDSTILVASGGLNAPVYQWIKDGSAIPGATTNIYIAHIAGTYKVRIQEGPCDIDTSDAAVVTILPPPTASITAPVQSICVGDTAWIQANTGAGYTYTWSLNGSTMPGVSGPVLAATQAGSYAVTVSNGGCVASSTPINIIVNPAPVVNLTPATNQNICTGTLVNFSTTANAAYTYTWKQNGVVISGATTNTYTTGAAGIYSVVVGSATCPGTASQPVTITVVTTPVASITAPVQHICAGSVATLQATTGAGYTYVWFRNGQAISGATNSSYGATQTGSYTVTVTNTPCSTTSTAVNIQVTPPPVVNVSPSANQFICPGSIVSFTTTNDPSYTYAWQLNGSSIPGATNSSYNTAAPGVYSVIVSNTICPNVSSQPVTVTIMPNSVHLGNDTFICNTSPFVIPVSVDPGFTQILWSTGQTTAQINIISAGTYWVHANDICGDFRDTITVTTIAAFTPNLPADTVICNAQNSAQISVPSGLQNILWNTGATTASIIITQPGTYWVEGTSPCGIMRDTIRVGFCKPEIQDIAFDNTICEGDCIAPIAEIKHQPDTYQWTFVGGNPATSVSPIPGAVCYNTAGVYPVTLIVRNSGGADTFITQVTVGSKPIPIFKDTTVTVTYKTNIAFPACAGAQIVDWYKDGKLVCANCPVLNIDAKDHRSTYYCVVRNGDCMDSCTYTLNVIDIPHDVWLPSAFSPNGDGRNDEFHIITDNPNIKVDYFGVFDRWGAAVFEANGSNKGWNGLVKGEPAILGTYFWLLRYKVLGSDEVYMTKGDVAVIR